MPAKEDSEASPTITLSLKGYPNLILNFGREALSDAAQILIRSHASKPVMLHLNGLRGEDYNFDLIPALQAGLIELVDAEAGEKISIQSGNQPVRPKTIEPRAIEEVQTIYFEPQNAFWKGLVFPSRDYLIRFSKDGGISECFLKDSEEQTGERKENPSKALSVRRDESSIRFTIRDDPRPPKFSLNLSASSSICHLHSESPLFEFVISITSQEEKAITVDIGHTPFIMYGGLSDIVCIEDEEFSEEVDMPYGQGCFLDNDGPEDFPQKTVPQEFLPGKAWVQKFALRHHDKETSNGGELEALEVETKYVVNLSNSVKNGFRSWRYGSEKDLPASEKERKKVFAGNGAIKFHLSGVPLEFCTAD